MSIFAEKKMTLPIEHSVDLRDEFVIEDVKYYVVQIDTKLDQETGRWVQEIYLNKVVAAADPNSYLPENPIQALREFVDEMGLDDRIDEASFKAAECAAVRFLSDDRIRAEVEAMDWPDVIE